MANLIALDAQGLRRSRLPEIKRELDARTIAALGAVNTEPDSVIGEYNGIHAAALDDLLASVEDVYYSQFISTASGDALRRAIQYVGMTAIEASYTEAVAIAYGKEGGFVPADSQCETEYQKTYTTLGDLTITRSKMAAATLKITIDPLSIYTVNIGGVNHVYQSVDGDKVGDVVEGLRSQIQGATADGDKLLVGSFDLKTPQPLAVTGAIEIVEVGSPVTVRATEIGDNHLAIGALSRIVTPAGWDRIHNPTQAVQGRAAEQDWEIRARHPSAIRIAGGGTEGAIKAQLIEKVEGVTGCIVISNRSAFDNQFGQTGNSIQCVVTGGLDSAVAQKIWEVKGAGVPTYGNVSQTVSDANGAKQTCRFSRSVPRYIWVKASPIADPERNIGTGYKSAIQQAILTAGKSAQIGGDVIRQSLECAGFQAIAGLASLTVEIAVTAKPTDSPIFGAVDIPINVIEVSDFDLARIEVVEIAR